MTSLRSASTARRRRAVAAVGAFGAGLLVLSACDKPTPIATITVGSSSVNSEASCYDGGKELKTAAVAECLKDTDIKSITVDPDETVRFGVDPEIADKGWTILMNGQPLTDASTKTYRTIPGSVFFNAQYGAQGNSTLVSIKEGENEVNGLWSFRLKKDS
ncbi:DUF2771 domain-containing protein [Streptomyces sp. ADMS]|uniref:DUF2771 domain-containing protein n=1 Tax=Streptomyces sp. ADMS TaxID=3071415 RepID=UPI00296F35FD|nr:DUF2771 domain-containing protein [Streptomyces sp. ADMS]MDW4908822.1 DUF2771 domain-containing protein [Streptomyces sp. ADMS]